MESIDLIFTPVLVRCFLGPLRLSGPMTLLGHLDTPNNPIGGYNPPPASTTHPTSLLPTHSLICEICDITQLL